MSEEKLEELPHILSVVAMFECQPNMRARVRDFIAEIGDTSGLYFDRLLDRMVGAHKSDDPEERAAVADFADALNVIVEFICLTAMTRTVHRAILAVHGLGGLPFACTAEELNQALEACQRLGKAHADKLFDSELVHEIVQDFAEPPGDDDEPSSSRLSS